MYMCTTCTPGACRRQEYLGFSGTGVTGGCELPGGYWELNPGLLQEQQWLLASKASLQTSNDIFFYQNQLNWNGGRSLLTCTHIR